MTPPLTSPLLTLPEAAERLRVSVATVRRADIVRVFDAYLTGTPSVDMPMLRDLKIRDLAYCVRIFSLSRDLWSKQMMLYAIKRLCGEMNMHMPPAHLLGKPAEQHQLEV